VFEKSTDRTEGKVLVNLNLAGKAIVLRVRDEALGAVKKETEAPELARSYVEVC
jgi:hypothetical protein